jgi:hypothetical protein
MTTFPALVPSSRTFTPGEYPATAFSGFSGAQNRVRHSNVFLAAQLRLTFLGLTQAQMLDIWNHYNGRRGEFRSFALPTEVVSYGSITDYVPGNYLWRYAGPGSVEDLPCGGHNVSLTLETVPPIAASVVGADLFLRLRLRAGAAGGGEYVEGISESVSLSLSPGAAFVSLNGVDLAIGLSLAAGAAEGDVSAFGINEGIVLSLEPGAASALSALGASETLTLSLSAGAADNGAISLEIGQAYGGGYFAGYISHTADGVATHALIVAPAATGASGSGYTITTTRQWKTANTTTSGTGSVFDGAANTAAMVADGINSHPAAKFCVDLTIGGFNDWYLPSREELDIAYFSLKPTTANNVTDNETRNMYSVPRRNTNYTTSAPARTTLTAFQSGGGEAFQASAHWSSGENGSTTAWLFSFVNGSQSGVNTKTAAIAVRAFRKVAI